MGMPVSVALRGRHADSSAGRHAWRAVTEQLRDADRVFSTYRADSAISRLGRGELTLDQCPPEVAEVLELGRQAEQQSGGAFSTTLPDENGRPRLDPSGVVKGWATQRASQYLRELDDTDFCLSAGGDVVCHTADPDGAAWRIGIEHPHDAKALIAVVPVRSGAVATSGTTHRGQHLLDARTGRPVTGVASVTVIGSLTHLDRHRRHGRVRPRAAGGRLAAHPARPDRPRGLARRDHDPHRRTPGNGRRSDPSSGLVSGPYRQHGH